MNRKGDIFNIRYKSYLNQNTQQHIFLSKMKSPFIFSFDNDNKLPISIYVKILHVSVTNMATIRNSDVIYNKLKIVGKYTCINYSDKQITRD
jgi:hypothetical protein